MIAQSVKRVILFWSRVDSVACWLAIGMLFLALVLDSGFCFLMAIGAKLFATFMFVDFGFTTFF